MSTYDRELFSSRTKEWLLDYIEQQIDQLNRFETRFKGIEVLSPAGARDIKCANSLSLIQ